MPISRRIAIASACVSLLAAAPAFAQHRDPGAPGRGGVLPRALEDTNGRMSTCCSREQIGQF